MPRNTALLACKDQTAWLGPRQDRNPSGKVLLYFSSHFQRRNQSFADMMTHLYTLLTLTPSLSPVRIVFI